MDRIHKSKSELIVLELIRVIRYHEYRTIINCQHISFSTSMITWTSRFICDVSAHLCSGFWLPNYMAPELTRIRKHPVKYRGYTCGPRSHRNSSSSMEFVHRADTAGWTFPAKCSVICV